MAYIDREKAIEHIETHTPYRCADAFIDGQIDCINQLKALPTADVVEVVRCKECKHYKANSCFNRQWDLESSVEIPLVREDDYCSYGERR